MAEDRRETFKRELAALTALDGVSGHEQAVVAYLRERMQGLADRIEVDPLGNLYATREGNGRHLMVGAHSDEIGALVANIEPAGFVRFQTVGGVHPGLLVGRKVSVAGHRGVVGLRPGHFDREARSGPPELNDLYIDLGLESGEEVRTLGIRAGDQITWRSELEETANPNRVVGKAVDNRVGALVALELLRAVQGETLPGRLTVVVAVQEEVGLKGAGVAAQRLQPDAALIIDTVPTADTPDTRQVNTFPVGLGRGPLFQVSSGQNARGFLLPAPIRQYLIETAERAAISYQLAPFAFGNTDAGSVYVAAGGVPTGVATIPRRYSHSPVEMLDVRDALATIRLAHEVARTMDAFPRGMMG